ncbi:hypothetical protein [Plantibacter sp. VKM Ac-2876]|uniref:hypothetical protein n=1 Tax=Plantibacter sp. VKM Ac-2876 TaxID=2783826 RepID=UPI00188A881D|nr:hypothetical protein [Plantibacter sp. VKM Ac-2876]MBF4563976.1 hypothetical protein [Plantibacter sp. VKM Ac-2876]
MQQEGVGARPVLINTSGSGWIATYGVALVIAIAAGLVRLLARDVPSQPRHALAPKLEVKANAASIALMGASAAWFVWAQRSMLDGSSSILIDGIDAIDAPDRPVLTIVGSCFLISVGWRFVLRRRLEYTNQWWLGEVAHRVAEKYDVEWSRIAQATRYRPMASGERWYKPWHHRAYRLKVAKEWWGQSRVFFELVVPVKEGRPIAVREWHHGQMRVICPRGGTSGGSSNS